MRKKGAIILNGISGLLGIGVIACCISGASTPSSGYSTPSPPSPPQPSNNEVSFVPAKIVITGGESPVDYGEIVDLKATPEGKWPTGLKQVKYKWKVFEIDPQTRKWSQKQNVKLDASGTELWFGSGIVPKTYHVNLAIAEYFESGSQHDIFVDETSTDVTIGRGPTPPIPPVPVPPGPTPIPPGPTPIPPGPVFPTSKYNLEPFTYQEANSISGDARVKGAQALTASFQGVASAIAAGAVKDLSDALKQTKQANADALNKAGVTVDTWQPFLKALSDKVYSLYTAKQLNNQNDLAEAWKEVATALQSIK